MAELIKEIRRRRHAPVDADRRGARDRRRPRASVRARRVGRGQAHVARSTTRRCERPADRADLRHRPPARGLAAGRAPTATIPTLVERFELVVAGRELANAYCELNDPVDQRARFEAEAQLPRRPATRRPRTSTTTTCARSSTGCRRPAGSASGIDRLVMLISGAEAIREVILFPTLRPEARRRRRAPRAPGCRRRACRRADSMRSPEPERSAARAGAARSRRRRRRRARARRTCSAPSPRSAAC